MNAYNTLMMRIESHVMAVGLRKLKDAMQKEFAAGVVLYDGEAVAGFGDRLFAVPISQLWEGD